METQYYKQIPSTFLEVTRTTTVSIFIAENQARIEIFTAADAITKLDNYEKSSEEEFREASKKFHERMMEHRNALIEI